MSNEEVRNGSGHVEEYCKAEEEFQEFLLKNLEVVWGIGADKLSRAYNVLYCFDY